MDLEDKIEKLLEDISNDIKYEGCVFWGPGVYFVIGNGTLWEISDDAGYSPRGGWFPDIVSGPSEEQTSYIKHMMEEIGFDECFFQELIEEYGEFDEDYVLEFFEENDDTDSLQIFSQIKKEVAKPNSPFRTLNDFASALSRYELDPDCLYYEWEGDYIDLHDNICETGESRGTYDSIEDEEWLEILENIDNHIVTAEE